MIPVTKTYLPSQKLYQDILKKSWDKQWITNRGDLVKELENKIKNQYKINNLFTTSNGTIPIQIALKAMGIKGEVITTPFSYVATTAAIVWENCTPIFVDIHPEYLTIDEAKIEDAITSKTSAILATHVYGNPCNIDAIDAIAKKHNIKVNANNNQGIILACANNHLDVVKYLISLPEKHGIKLNANNNYGIYLASESGHLDMVKYLISLPKEYGIKLNTNNKYLYYFE